MVINIKDRLGTNTLSENEEKCKIIIFTTFNDEILSYLQE